MKEDVSQLHIVEYKILLKQWFASRADFARAGGHMTISGDIFGCYNHEGNANSIQRIETRDTVQHPQIQWTDLHK